MQYRDIVGVMARHEAQRMPLQVYFEPRQLELLRELAGRRRQPLTHLVRESVERYLVDEIGEDDPLLGLVGMIDSGEPDTVSEHDRVIVEDELARIDRDATPPTFGGRRNARGAGRRRG